ncbi:MAG: bifunctional hydroxymethylpyrimidine kinase/phosphomethylpyrimidine kinase [Deltaproteobacteria bacterium]|nr:bifunctional hydroxymethylpyrimidine kinase/phosphomethylpyrimidine kinase [Deltaproteobacteria bacterium]
MKKTGLSIAGFDPSGGAGVMADVKTFESLGLYGLGVITTLTVQDTKKVYRAESLEPQLVFEQIIRLFEDFQIDVVKIGMLGNESVVRSVCKALKNIGEVPIVLDPVILSSSGHELLDEDGIEFMIDQLLPLATIITPNLMEAERISGISITSRIDMENAARLIQFKGAQTVIIKGGHRKEDADDLLFHKMKMSWYPSQRSQTESVHGSGCVYSSAIAGNYALNNEIEEVVKNAKGYILKAINHSLSLGKGENLIDHGKGFEEVVSFKNG